MKTPLFGTAMNDEGNKFGLPACPFEVYTFDGQIDGLKMSVTLGADYLEFTYNGDSSHPIALMAREIMWFRTLQLETTIVDNRLIKEPIQGEINDG